MDKTMDLHRSVKQVWVIPAILTSTRRQIQLPLVELLLDYRQLDEVQLQAKMSYAMRIMVMMIPVFAVQVRKPVAIPRNKVMAHGYHVCCANAGSNSGRHPKIKNGTNSTCIAVRQSSTLGDVMVRENGGTTPVQNDGR